MDTDQPTTRASTGPTDKPMGMLPTMLLIPAASVLIMTSAVVMTSITSATSRCMMKLRLSTW